MVVPLPFNIIYFRRRGGGVGEEVRETEGVVEGRDFVIYNFSGLMVGISVERVWGGVISIGTI